MIVTALIGCGNTQAGGKQVDTLPLDQVTVKILSTVQPTAQPTVPPSPEPSVEPTIEPAIAPLIPGPLISPPVSLRAGPVDVPLELRIPSIQVSASVIGVGLTAENLMDAPKGPADDPVWHQVFWFRGGGIPGDSGTATFAGHVDDPLGRPTVFTRINELRPGDQIVVHDTRSGNDVHFIVTETKVYSLEEASDPSVLTRVYGSGPVTGGGPQPAPDGLSHLALITCSGDFVSGAYDLRIVVYATQRD